MKKIDVKDRKILYELDLNCRQSNSQIGKKVGLGRDVVGYRIDKLKKNGIITNFYSIIDTFRLGYNVFRLYINFHYVTPEIKKEIIDFFVDYKYSWVVVTVKSEIDLDVVIWVKNIYEFYQFWDRTLDKYEKYIEKHAISIYIKSSVFMKSYLLPNKLKTEKRSFFDMNCGVESVDIDETDYYLLNEIAENARISLVDLGEKLDCSSQKINYRLDKLVEIEVIKAFRVNIDLAKLGLQKYKVNIYLKNHELKKPVFSYLSQKKYIEFMNFALGWADLEPEFVVKDFNELLQILEEINQEFSGAIKKQTFFIAEKLYKQRCLPELYK
ncbi:MAG: Lrp/AsnC family transcriptional regulator [Candidatus Thermoplasmatota archaeon]|nr:Lrp/AsnC family transcriptional regulator [Candidatus Thermoplasmatota archaeon]MBS3802541.1 Lrp/AsnC family transcriptional regulator [Candidatus Thermoplasmatota archaeon]